MLEIFTFIFNIVKSFLKPVFGFFTTGDIKFKMGLFFAVAAVLIGFTWYHFHNKELVNSGKNEVIISDLQNTIKKQEEETVKTKESSNVSIDTVVDNTDKKKELSNKTTSIKNKSERKQEELKNDSDKLSEERLNSIWQTYCTVKEMSECPE